MCSGGDRGLHNYCLAVKHHKKTVLMNTQECEADILGILHSLAEPLRLEKLTELLFFFLSLALKICILIKGHDNISSYKNSNNKIIKENFPNIK